MTATCSKAVSKTSSKTRITVEQSQKLIQTMLTMSFGCLAFLRGLFPDDSFVDQRFVPEKVEKDYKKQDGVSGNSIKIKTLVRGKSSEIDLLLNWLEKGVFQSIKLKYLRALSLGIFLDENDPTDLLENYIFSFDYDDEDNFRMQVGTQTKGDESASSVSLLDSRKMAQQLMRRFIIITQSLEPLPQRKYLTLRLMFNDSAPPDYQPHLFKDATFEKQATVKVPLNADTNATSVGTLNTDHHQLSLKVLSAADCDPELNCEGNSNSVPIDPFDLVDDIRPERNFSQDYVASQTTSILGHILKSSHPNIQPTQAVVNKSISDGTCECAVDCPAESTTFKTCKTCRKKVHGICYGNSRGSAIERCMTCVCGSALDTESNAFKDLIMLRKIYRLIGRSRSIPDSVTLLVKQLFGLQFKLDEETEERIAFCLSVLFHDNVLSIEGEAQQQTNSQSIRFSTSVQIDISGVIAANQVLLEKDKVYPLCFRYNSYGMHSCFTDVVGESKQQIEDWFKQIRDLRDLLIVPKPSSYNFESLQIGDTNNFELNKQARKRKNNDLHQYLKSEQESISSETDTNKSEKGNAKKIRKISVSKKSLRSVW